MLGGFYATTISDAQRTAKHFDRQSRIASPGMKGTRQRSGTNESEFSHETHASDPTYLEYKPSFRFCLDSMVVDLIKSVDDGIVHSSPNAHSKTKHNEKVGRHHVENTKKPIMRVAYSGGIFT
ncbi:hypothetical protein THRCLA_20931 [Thraustotheca clavata]|uniref:Uncharacterized protein n=1 Tax=Thraustotheca clavata TaxID=74557 RepID=A0A1W0A1U5_9STRA|nr:hypothetical protein THRCLA_20931 [Thraustotheca clavata]